MFCSDVKATAALGKGEDKGVSMGVGLRPKAKAMEKPPNPKAANWSSHQTLSIGGSDLGGEQTRGPEHKGMTAIPKEGPVLKSLHWVRCGSRPDPNAGKAVGSWEETGKCTTRTAGIGVQARGERHAEITSGRSHSQQGLTATCKDLPNEASSHREQEGLGLAREPV